MRLASSSLLSIGLLLLLACGGAGPEPGGEAGGITLSAPSTEVVEGFTLDVEATSADPKNASLVWSSDDLRIASVDQDGRVLGCAEGPVTIAARSPATGARSTIDLRVLPDADFNTQLPIDASNLAPTVERTSTIERCEVTLEFSGIAARVVKGRYRRYHRLKLPFAGVLGDVGKPELPFYTLHFALPVDPQTRDRATWNVTVERESPLAYPDIRPWPHQPPAWMDGESEEEDAPPPFVVNEASYDAQEARPARAWWAEAVEIGNLPVLVVRVAPLRYLPAARRLELYETTRVIVTFEGAGQLVMPRPLGDYKAIQERGADQRVADTLQNNDLLTPVTAVHLNQPLPPIDELGVMDTPFDLLIVTRASLEAPARRLARWRQDHGTRVWLAVLDETLYPDADAVRDAVIALDEANLVEVTDDHHRHAIMALLIFGDVEHIPTFMGRRQRNQPVPTAEHPDNVLVAGTDLPYSTLHGGDDQVDFLLGRISVDDATQGEAVVDKIVAYESLPAGQFPHRAAIYGYFEDHPEPLGTVGGTVSFTSGSRSVTGVGTSFSTGVEIGDLVRPNTRLNIDDGDWPVRVASVLDDLTLQLEHAWPTADVTTEDGLQIAREDRQEDKPFVAPAEEVREFLNGHGVPVQWGYTRTRGIGTTPEPYRDFAGNVLHADLLASAWDVDASEISTNWGEGRDGIVLHSGYGGPTRWNEPAFRKTDLAPFGPGAGPWYPIVFCIDSSTGYFDSETDLVWVWNEATASAVLATNTPAAGHWPQHDVSFCEHLLRIPDGGGVAAVGPSRGTTSRYNEQLIHYLFDALYTEYEHNPIYPGGGIPAREYAGSVFSSAMYNLWNWFWSPDGPLRPESWEYCLQSWHYFGDPLLRIRAPQQAVDD